jgi:hypothetical protein
MIPNKKREFFSIWVADTRYSVVPIACSSTDSYSDCYRIIKQAWGEKPLKWFADTGEWIYSGHTTVYTSFEKAKVALYGIMMLVASET